MLPNLPMVPGPYGRQFPVPQGMPMPGSMPVPGGSLPPMPLPPWGDWPGPAAMTAPAMPGGLQMAVPVAVQAGPAPMAGPAAAQAMTAGAAVQTLPTGAAYPPSVLDFQTTVTANPITTHLPTRTLPTVAPSAFIAPHTTLIGDVTIGEDVFIGFGVVLRADYGSPFFVGPRSNVLDHVTMHGEADKYVEAAGRRWSVYLEGDVSCLHNALLHGPLRVGKNVYIGAGAVVDGADVGENCVILHNATVTGGVRIPAGRLVGAGQTVQSQAEADALPEVPAGMRQLNPQSIAGYVELAKAYGAQFPVALTPAG